MPLDIIYARFVFLREFHPDVDVSSLQATNEAYHATTLDGKNRVMMDFDLEVNKSFNPTMGERLTFSENLFSKRIYMNTEPPEDLIAIQGSWLVRLVVHNIRWIAQDDHEITVVLSACDQSCRFLYSPDK